MLKKSSNEKLRVKLTKGQKIYAFIALLFFIFWLANVIYVNVKYPAPQIISVPMGQSAYVNNVAITIKSSDILEIDDEKISEFILDSGPNQSVIPMMTVQGWQAKLLIAEVEVENQGKETAEFLPHELIAECKQWVNGMDSGVAVLMSENYDEVQALESGQKETVYIAFDLFDRHFSEENWENIEELPFVIPLSLYSEKLVLELRT